MNKLYRQAAFEISVSALSQLPEDDGIEVAFAGRSNAGKSSALNVITSQRSLARTSKTPGRTQLINLFGLGDNKRLVDLPGYGYAKVPERIKRHWQQLLENYLQQRTSLHGLVIVMDVRRPLTTFDEQLLSWCNLSSMPVHILLTKADKLSRGAASATLHQVQKTLKETYIPTIENADEERLIPTVQLFSALKKIGVDQAHAKLDEWFELNQATPGEA